MNSQFLLNVNKSAILWCNLQNKNQIIYYQATRPIEKRRQKHTNTHSETQKL